MSTLKEELLKTAEQVRKEGVSVKTVSDLMKKASDLKIAYLVSLIKNN